MPLIWCVWGTILNFLFKIQTHSIRIRNHEMIQNQGDQHKNCRCYHVRTHKSSEGFTTIENGNNFGVTCHFSRKPNHADENDQKGKHISEVEDETHVILKHQLLPSGVSFEEIGKFLGDIKNYRQKHHHPKNEEERFQKTLDDIFV